VDLEELDVDPDPDDLGADFADPDDVRPSRAVRLVPPKALFDRPPIHLSPTPRPPSVGGPSRASSSIAPSTMEATVIVPRPGRGWRRRAPLVAATTVAVLGALVAWGPSRAAGLSALASIADRSERSAAAASSSDEAEAPPPPGEAAPARGDELDRALARVESGRPLPSPKPVADPCEGLAKGGRAICEWAGLVSVGAEVDAPSLSTVIDFLRATGVRHAMGFVVEPLPADRGWPVHRVSVDWESGFCLSAPPERLEKGASWSAWVFVPSSKRDREADCMRAEIVGFAEPLIELRGAPTSADAPKLALRFRRELAAFTKRNPRATGE
jgi:hypothetical protein